MKIALARVGIVVAALFAFGLAPGCGSSTKSSSSVSSNAGGAGGAGVAGNVSGALNLAGTGGLSGSGGAAASAGTSGAAQAGSAQGGGGGSALGASECGQQMAKLSGTWDSSAWQESYAVFAGIATYTSAAGAGWQFHTLLNTDGYILLRGQGPNPKLDGVAHPVTVILNTPSVGPTPAGWYCSSSNSTMTDDAVDTQVKLSNLGRLGACADGVSVAGQISICDADLGFPQDCDFTRSGTLDGMTITTANWDATQGTYLVDIDLVYPDGMVISYDRSGEQDMAGPDTNGLVILPDGTIYCAGAASTHMDSNEQMIDTLTDFKRLGTCANITGANTAQGCLGAH